MNVAWAAIVPLYNGETAPKALRGTLLVLYQLQIIIGWVFFAEKGRWLTE